MAERAQSRRSERALFIAVAVLAVVTPSVLAAVLKMELGARTEPRMSARTGAPVTIAWADVTPSGGLRFQDVRVGEAVSLSAVELYPDLSSLGSSPRLEEIRLVNPRWRWKSGAAASRGAAPARPSPPLRDMSMLPPRLVVENAEVEVDLGDHGYLVAIDVEIAPRPGGFRAVAGRLSGAFRLGPWSLSGTFPRLAADVVWPALHVERVVAAGGALAFRAGDQLAELDSAVLSYGVSEPGHTELNATFVGGATLTAEVGSEPGAAFVVRGAAVPMVVLSPVLPPGVRADRATVSGTATVDTRRRHLHASGHVKDLEFDHNRLAPEPIPTAFGLELDGSWSPVGESIAFELVLARLAFRGLHLAATGRFQLGADARAERMDLFVTMERAPCARVFHAIPRALKSDLAGLELAGALSFRGHLFFDLDDLDATRVDVDLNPRACRVKTEPPGADARCALPSASRPRDCQRLSRRNGRFVPLAELPRYMPRAFVVSEDGRFYGHRGFDQKQIERSLAKNLATGRLRRGGSTITQQVAKNLFLSHERTFARKLQEVVLAWRLEHHLSKEQILEQYINLVQLSDSDYGIDPGARYWFGKKPSALEPKEVAFLATILPAPRTYGQRLRENGGVDDATRGRVNKLLRRLAKVGAITRAEYRKARKSPLVVRPEALHAEK